MSSSNKLKSLLNYSTSLSQQASDSGDVQTTASTTTPQAPGRKLDASMLQAIMGPDDAQLMMESMQAIEDPTLPDDQHEIAFENLEALVEQIDNAKNLENMKLWAPLITQLDKPGATFRRGGCAVIATAVQNNPVSQADFLRYGGLGRLLELFTGDSDVGVRKKALFALTCTIRNNPAGLAKFGKLGGWKVFSEFLDAVRDRQMQKRIIFFLGTLYQEDSADLNLEETVTTGFPPKLVSLLSHEEVQDDEDVSEKILVTLNYALASNPEVLNKELKHKLKALATKMRARYGTEMCNFESLYKLLE